MSRLNRLFDTASTQSPYLEMARSGKTPAEVKGCVLSVLRPHFTDPSVLDRMPLPAMAHEAVALVRTQEHPWLFCSFQGLLAECRRAIATDATQSATALFAWDDPVIRGMSEFMSIYLMEMDKSELGLEELRLEAFRNIGGMLEACVQPQLKAVLHLVRIGRGRPASFSSIQTLKFGTVVQELHQKLNEIQFLAPPPWNLKLHQWRNIAQHHSSAVQGNTVLCSYREGNSDRQVVLSPDGLLHLMSRLQDVLGAVRVARSIIIADNVSLLGSRRLLVAPRPEIALFELAVGLSTQGFEVKSIDLADEKVHLVVQDVIAHDRKLRMVHSSQFVVPLWQAVPRQSVAVTYQDCSGQPHLITTVAGVHCEAVISERMEFSELAERVDLKFVSNPDSLSRA